jgi:hypothetical protein
MSRLPSGEWQEIAPGGGYGERIAEGTIPITTPGRFLNPVIRYVRKWWL